MHKEVYADTGPSAGGKRALAARLLKARSALARRAPGCLHRIVEAHAALTPSAVALACDGRSWTYGEVNARANRLARRLRSLGVGVEVPVGVYADRSAETVIGLLGVLKAGGAYVPIDPAYPVERVSYLLADSGVPVLLTPARMVGDLPEHSAVVVDLDDECLDERDDDLPGGAGPDNAAYVIYTSGSTGRPKGVVVTHANVTHLLASTQDWYGFGPDDVWTLFHSFAFDFSVWEIWGALTFGGRLVVVPFWVSRSPDAFHALLRGEGVTVLNQTPSAFRQLVKADEEAGRTPDEPLNLRLVIFGGEALELEALRPWFEAHGDRSPRLVNMYGITETTVHVTYRPVSASDLETAAGTSPIGEAIPGWRVLLLDAQLRPVPVGVVGEIHVGGLGLARGYLNRPSLTAERFVSDPYSDQKGARLYRSGDLARRRPDGSLEYLGRSDHQVKVRGFRIELGEIETALARHPGVREAVVLVREDRPGDRRLVAYVVTRREGPVDPGALREWLKPKLPDYMVPAVFVGLESLPLTLHGKVDRQALPAPELTRAWGFEPPRTPVEEAVAAAWSDVLGRDKVGVNDNFFDLGGHSLLATQVVSRVRDTLGVDVPLRSLFETPTVAGLARDAELLLRDGTGSGPPPLEPATRRGPARASYAQQRLWFLDQLEPGRPWYNIPAAVRLTGNLDRDALSRAFHEVVRRHDVLRTTFTAVDATAVQVIGPATGEPLAAVDLGEVPDDKREAEALRRARDESWRPFDLARGPLFRATLFRLGVDDHLISVTMHHAVSDGWSMGVLVRELASLYSAFSRGEASPLPALPVQYADFAEWQRAWLEGGAIEAQLGLLRETLSGIPPLELPTDRPRPAVLSGRGGERTRDFPGRLTVGLKELGRAEGATLFMTLLAGFEALLHRYSGQMDFAVGSPVAGRSGSKTEGLIGFFVNTLVLRADLSDGPSFRELLRRVRRSALGAYSHQDVPFEQLVAALDPKRDPSRTPLFQAMFALQNAPLPEIETPGLTLKGVELGGVSAKFDLTLSVRENDDGLTASLEYSADLFDAATADRMLAHLENLLDSAVSDPERPVADLPMITRAEQLDLECWNATDVDVPTACVHELFEAQAGRTPDAVAVGFEGRTLTYASLDAASNRLAGRLKRQGVGPGVLVAVFLERGPGMVVGLLGVLKAGGAYLPLDPAFPPARLAHMLGQAKVPVVLTEASLRGELPAHHAAVVCLDDQVNEGTERVEGGARPDDLAYVIFTSGSTGTPKGVMVPHSALTNFLTSMAREPGLSAADTLLAVTTLSFDIAALEIFLPLTVGARVEVVTREVAGDGDRLARALKSTGATVLQATPASWRLLTESGWGGDPGLTILCGGEALTRDLARKLLARGRSVWNLYGPTETTVWSTLSKVEPDTGPVPVGRPIANTRVYVLDGRLNPVPAGVTGELYIGGKGVARGYLNRPDLTSERFLVDPFTPSEGGRMYRTGDLARFRPDGVLECLGRSDGQVKVRGYRVELGDVEASLTVHPRVKAAAATAVTDPAGFLRIVAYVVPRDGDPDANTLAAAELKLWLKNRLPEYMIPSTFTFLETLPLTPNGKVDRKALPDPGPAVSSGEPLIEPRDEVERRLVVVWEEVLQVRPVGVNQSFFDLGGHSLLAIRLLGRIEEEFGRRLPLAALFSGPTVEELAHVLRAREVRSTGGAWTPLVSIQGEGTKPPFFCVHPAGGIVYCFQDLARQLGSDRPFFALQAAGLDGDEPPFEVFEAMAARYVEAVRAEQPDGPYHLGGWSLGGVIAFEMARQLEHAGQQVATVSLFDSWAPTAIDRTVAEAQRALAREVAALGVFHAEGLTGNDEELAFVLGQFPPELVEEFGGDALRLVAHLRELPPDDRRAYVLKAFQLDLVYHLETGPERVERLWSVLRANLIAGSKYEPGPYRGRVILFRAGDAKDAPSTDPQNGWDALALGGVTVHKVPGDHTTILRGSNLRVLAGALRAELEAADGTGERIP